MKSRFLVGFNDQQSELLAEFVVESYDDLVTRRDFAPLRDAVADLAVWGKRLAVAQQETQVELKHLAVSHDRLAVSQKEMQTEVRNLAVAQKETQIELKNLAASQAQT